MGPGQHPAASENSASYQLFYKEAASGKYVLTPNSADLPQLVKEWPLVLFPFIFMLPRTGNVLMIAGHSSVIYHVPPNGPLIASRHPANVIPRLEVAVSYPQTAAAVLLTLTPAQRYVPTVWS